MATITALPPVTVESTADRSIKSTWTLGLTGDDRKVNVALTTRHNRESKTYGSTITWTFVGARDGFTVTEWASDHAYGVLQRERADRYSVKHLRALAEAALELVVGPARCGEHVFAEALSKVITQA